MGHHFDDQGRFQSDKHPDMPPDRLRVSIANPRSARALLQLAKDYREHDPEFSDDLRRRVVELHGDPETVHAWWWADVLVFAKDKADAVEMLEDEGREPERFPLEPVTGPLDLTDREGNTVVMNSAEWFAKLGRRTIESE